MNEQPEFFGPNLGVLESALRPTAAPHNGTDTSAAMARKVMRRGKSAADESLLLAWLEQRGAMGATDEEIRERFGWSGDYERPRRWALEQDGLVVDSKAARRNAKGNLMTVWVARRILICTAEAGRVAETI